MKKTFLILFVTLAAFVSQAQTFTLKSKDIGGQATNKQLFNSFGCHGDNLSPQLYWENAPEGTKSFAVTIYDKDAPTGSGFWHWVIFNISSSTNELKTNAGNVSSAIAPPGAVQSTTDFGVPGYGGPCPPPGPPHEYLITVYALKVDNLNLNKTATAALVGFALNQNTLSKASIVMYAKQ